MRWSIRGGSPLDDPGWVESNALRLGLESTVRSRSRRRKQSRKAEKES
jgi:hypothetical protein